MEGYLFKKGLINPSFKKRWFLLDLKNEQRINYFRSEPGPSSTAEPKGSIVLQTIYGTHHRALTREDREEQRFSPGGSLLLLKSPKRIWHLIGEAPLILALHDIVELVLDRRASIIESELLHPTCDHTSALTLGKPSDLSDSELYPESSSSDSSNYSPSHSGSPFPSSSSSSSSSSPASTSSMGGIPGEDSPIPVVFDTPNPVPVALIKISLISIDVVGVKLQDTEKGGKSHHDFVIRCQTSNGGVWEVFRRFRNFVALNAALCSSEPWWMEVSNLPPKKVFGHLEEEFVNKRRNALQIYIYTLEKYEPIVRHPEFLLFLDPRTPNPAEYSERRWWKAMKQAHLATPPLSTHPVSSPSSSLYSSAELMPLAAEFRVSCQNSAGLEKSEFHTLLSRRCPGISRDHANLLFSASLHTSGGTVLTFTTYLRTLFVLTQGTPTQKAEMAFLVIDLNRDTVITIDELYSLATSFEWFSRGSFLSSNQEPIVSSYGSTTAMQTSCEDFLISIITAGGTEMDSERRVSRKLVVTMDHFVRAMIAEPILLTRLGIPQLCQPGSDAKPSARTRTKSPSRAKSPNRAQPPSGN